MKAHKLIFLFIVLFLNLNTYSQSIEEYKMIERDTILYSNNEFRVIDYSNFKLTNSILKRDVNKKIIVYSEDSTFREISYDTITSNFKIIEITTHPQTYKKIGKKIIKFNSYFYLMKEISTNKYYYLIQFDYKDEKNPVLELEKVYNLTLKSVFHEDLSNFQCEFSSDFVINNFLVLQMRCSYMYLHTLFKYNYSIE